MTLLLSFVDLFSFAVFPGVAARNQRNRMQRNGDSPAEDRPIRPIQSQECGSIAAGEQINRDKKHTYSDVCAQMSLETSEPVRLSAGSLHDGVIQIDHHELLSINRIVAPANVLAKGRTSLGGVATLRLLDERQDATHATQPPRELADLKP